MAQWREATRAQRHGGETPENGTKREKGGKGKLGTSSKYASSPRGEGTGRREAAKQPSLLPKPGKAYLCGTQGKKLGFLLVDDFTM